MRNDPLTTDEMRSTCASPIGAFLLYVGGHVVLGLNRLQDIGVGEVVR